MTKFLAFAGTAIAGVVVGLLLSASGVHFGGVYNQVSQYDKAGLPFAGMLKGTGILIGPTYTVTASTTLPFDIAVPGVIPTDLVFAEFATSSAASNGWVIVGASASSTPGFVTLRVSNLTGANTLLPASLASTTQYQVIR